MIGHTIERSEVARAFGKTPEEFENMMPGLSVLGFPAPLGETDHWQIVDLLDWITAQQEANLAFVTYLTRFLDS